MTSHSVEPPNLIDDVVALLRHSSVATNERYTAVDDETRAAMKAALE